MLKKQLLLFLFSGISFTASAQFWDVFVETLLLDGFWYVIVEDPQEPNWQETTFASYPYDLRGSGLYLPTNLEGDQSRLNLNVHVQSTDRDIIGTYAQLKYSPISLITLDAYRLQYFDTERDPGTENINLTSAAIIYNRLRDSKIHAWWGLGALWLDSDENFTSATFNVGANYFFKDPISLYGEAQLGVIDEDFVSMSQIRLQLHLKRYLIYGGYQSMQIGDLDRKGWMFGGGVYF